MHREHSARCSRDELLSVSVPAVILVFDEKFISKSIIVDDIKRMLGHGS